MYETKTFNTWENKILLETRKSCLRQTRPTVSSHLMIGGEVEIEDLKKRIRKKIPQMLAKTILERLSEQK